VPAPSKQKLFEAHGCEFTGSAGDQLIATCPFTGKADKFYVNRETWLWDSKTAGLSGNVSQFLKFVQDRYEQAMTPALRRRLAEDRGLPEAAFKPWHIGWTGSQYSVPVLDPTGNLVDIRLYKLGKRIMSTPCVQVGLLGVQHFRDDMAVPVYLCEGEWDAMALRWLLKTVNEPGIVCAVPGASIFKQEWAAWFSGRTVHTLFDADETGDNAELAIWRKIGLMAQRMTFVYWPSEVKSGFDVRDWIIYGAVQRNTPVECWKALQGLFRLTPRKRPMDGIGVPTPAATGQPSSNGNRPSRWTKAPTLEDVCTTFKKWLHLDTTDAIKIMLACSVSQDIPGPPIWLFLVGPPGGGKTEAVVSLSAWERAYLTSSLTPHALISGANWKEGMDPSLIPRLNGKVMVIKDFTAILSMRDMERDEIFGILRDAYDGTCRKVFGTGLERTYHSRFTIVAAVTPRIHDLSSQHASLGERFLKYSMGDNLHHDSEEDIIGRAIDNIAQTTQMQDELQDVVTSFLTRRVVMSKDKLPTISESIKSKIIALGMFGARMRGSVSRDKYRNDIVTSKPSAEIGSRLGIQLAKLAKSLAAVHNRTTVTDDDYRLLKKVMLDTLPQRTEDIIRHMILAKNDSDFMTIDDIAKASRYPVATVSRIMSDLHVLDIVERKGTSYRFMWTISKYIRDAVQRAQLYRTIEEQTRPSRLWIKLRVTRGRKSKLVIGKASHE
jgi:hypothetical protein